MIIKLYEVSHGEELFKVPYAVGGGWMGRKRKTGRGRRVKN